MILQNSRFIFSLEGTKIFSHSSEFLLLLQICGGKPRRFSNGRRRSLGFQFRIADLREGSAHTLSGDDVSAASDAVSSPRDQPPHSRLLHHLRPRHPRRSRSSTSSPPNFDFVWILKFFFWRKCLNSVWDRVWSIMLGVIYVSRCRNWLMRDWFCFL